LELKNGDVGKLDENEATNGASSNGETTEKTDLSDRNNNDHNKEENDGKGGFQLPQAVTYAIFLPRAAHTIKPNGRICFHSPCMEQTQQTVVARGHAPTWISFDENEMKWR